MHMKRKGSSIAAEIVAEWRREEYFKKRIKQNKCILDSKKQCNICKYREACEDNNSNTIENITKI